MKVISTLCFLLLLLLGGCATDDDGDEAPCLVPISERNFKMGFTSWPFGPNLQDVDDTYAFLAANGDIYAEHIDNQIPWNAWINDLPLPTNFTNEITGKVNRKIAGKQLLLSVSLLNSNRDELATDMDGTVPSYTNLDDTDLKNAYFKHIDYLVDAFNPDYLVIAIEVNELLLRSPDKWEGYKNLIVEVTSRTRQAYPNLQIAESVSLHNLYEPDVTDPSAFINAIFDRISQNDFVAISFYPFLKNLSTKAEFQAALDFLHSRVNRPIAFVETSQIAENLEIPNLNVSIAGNAAEQQLYLETLLENAETQDYAFIIWWAHRDFDALWATFPDAVKDLGQIWRDTGLLDENGTERPAFTAWSNRFQN